MRIMSLEPLNSQPLLVKLSLSGIGQIMVYFLDRISSGWSKQNGDKTKDIGKIQQATELHWLRLPAFWNGNSPKHHQCTFSFALQAALLPFTIGYWPNTTIAVF